MTLPEDERAEYRAKHHVQRRRLPAGLIGFLLIFVSVIGPYLAFTRHIPFTSRGYQLSAEFESILKTSTRSPVRIAGVDVGEVVGREGNGDTSTLTFTVDDSGRPIHEDASVKIRPRMFFEGNYFLALDPGSPSAPEMESGETIPVTRTSTPVQFDEILTALQEPERKDLADLLEGYGGALNYVPTPADDRTQTPSVHGRTGAEALNLAFGHGPEATRFSAQVAEKFRGRDPHDLSRLIEGSAETFAALARNEQQLSELVTNWATFTRALADEQQNLSATFAELAPTLETSEESFEALNATLPALRGFAREFEPAVAEIPDTITAADPWLEQASPLLSNAEAGGLARLLRQSMPGLTGAAREGLGTLTEISNLSRCTSEVLVPTGDQVIADRFSTGQPNSREFFYAATNVAGESQNFDGNGPFLRLHGGGGPISQSMVNPDPNDPLIVPGQPPKIDTTLWAFTATPPLGTQPRKGPKPPFKPEVPCHTNEAPDLNSGVAEPGPPTPAPAPLP